jgi:hypothetical protein
MGRRRDRDGIGGRGAHRVLVLLAPRRRPRAGCAFAVDRPRTAAGHADRSRSRSGGARHRRAV